MKDRFGYERGACTRCGVCEEFTSQEESVKCANCGCKPVSHERIDSIPYGARPSQNDIEIIDIEIDTSVETDTNITTYTGQSHDVLQVYHEPVCIGSECGVPGCKNEVDFDINSGKELFYCYLHNNYHVPHGETLSLHSDCCDDDVIVIDDKNTDCYHDDAPFDESYYSQDSNSDYVHPKCAIDECPNLCYIDEDGTVHQCCGKTHAMEYHKRQSMQIVSMNKCAISECPNQCYIDENGTVHECCGVTHAMEHQRRQALQIALGSNILKGISHCLLPECNNIAWPFENYCGKTHAIIGRQRGLKPPNSASNQTDDNSTVCILTNCTRPKFIDTNGIVHPYCGKSHANLAKQLGIFPMTSNTDEQCELEGCTRQRYKEGTRVHEYCCAEHARQDAPNREANKILTSMDKVKMWLNQFKNFKVVSMEENDHAKPPNGVLFKKFKQKMQSLPKDKRQTQLAFHGTSPNNISSICQNGYDPSRRCGQSYGAGEYFATTPDVSLGYCRQGNKMLLNELLMGQSGTHHTQHGNIIVMKDPAHDLPRFILTFS